MPHTPSEPPATPLRETRSICPYCGVGCGVIIESQGPQITGVRGDPDHPANFGRLCSKGASLHHTASHTVKVSGEEVSLTPKEFDLLVFLASNKGIALSREKILQKVWNYDYFGEDRTVDTHVKMLRGHLGKCRSYIATVWGIGYKFDPDAVR